MTIEEAIVSCSKKNHLWSYAAKAMLALGHEKHKAKNFYEFAEQFSSDYNDNRKMMEKMFTVEVCKTIETYWLTKKFKTDKK